MLGFPFYFEFWEVRSLDEEKIEILKESFRGLSDAVRADIQKARRKDKLLLALTIVGVIAIYGLAFLATYLLTG